MTKRQQLVKTGGLKMNYRVELMNAIDDGLIDPVNVVEMFTSWMTNDDIKEMLEANRIVINEDLDQ